MTASEVSRRALYARLEEVLGSEYAATLMTHLPAEETTHFATKHDIAGLRGDIQRLEARMDVVDERFYAFQETVRDQFRSYSVTVVASMTALTGIFGIILAITR